MVIYSLLSDTVLSIKKENLKKKKKNQRSKSHGIKVLYIGHRFIYGTPQCLH